MNTTVTFRNTGMALAATALVLTATIQPPSLPSLSTTDGVGAVSGMAVALTASPLQILQDGFNNVVAAQQNFNSAIDAAGGFWPAIIQQPPAVRAAEDALNYAALVFIGYSIPGAIGAAVSDYAKAFGDFIVNGSPALVQIGAYLQRAVQDFSHNAFNDGIDALGNIGRIIREWVSNNILAPLSDAWTNLTGGGGAGSGGGGQCADPPCTYRKASSNSSVGSVPSSAGVGLPAPHTRTTTATITIPAPASGLRVSRSSALPAASVSTRGDSNSPTDNENATGSNGTTHGSGTGHTARSR